METPDKSSPDPEAKASLTPLEQAAAALVESAAQFGVTVVPAYVAITEILFETGATMPVVMGPSRSTLAEALADAAPFGCGVALSHRVILSRGGDDPARPEHVEPEPPADAKPRKLAAVH